MHTIEDTRIIFLMKKYKSFADRGDYDSPEAMDILEEIRKLFNKRFGSTN